MAELGGITEQIPLGLEPGDQSNMSTPSMAMFGKYFETTAWMKWCLIPACIIFILFCFLEKRVNLWPNCCHGRPSVAYPVNLVDSYSNRWAFAFAFGSMSIVLIKAVVTGPLLVTPDDIASVTLMLQGTVQFFAYLVDALVISLVFYPILQCLQTRWRLLGNILGLLYSSAWLVFYICSILLTAMSSTVTTSPTGLFFKILQQLGLFGTGAVCFLALVIFFFVGLTKELRNRFKQGFTNEVMVDFTKTHFYHRVKFLLTPPLSKKTSGNIIVRLFGQYIGSVPGFKFSRRNICTLGLTVVTTIQIVLVWLNGFGSLKSILYQTALFREFIKYFPELEEDLYSVEVCFWITSVVAVIFTASYIVDMQLRYRKHTVKLWKGNQSCVTRKKLIFSETLVASLRYSGYQVAFTMWGFIIMQLVLWSILTFIILFDSIALHLLEKYWLTIAVAILFFYSQVIISQIVFLQKAPDQHRKSVFTCWKQASFGLDNRRVFHVAVYFLMFVNFILGIVSCLLRMLKALALGTLYLGRMDRLLLMRDWEAWDRGYTAYVGFLQLEVAHTHPVLITFCHFLLKTVETNELVCIVNAQIESRLDLRNHQLLRRVRNRWLVMLTLARNPQLVAQRKRAIMKTSQTKDELFSSENDTHL